MDSMEASDWITALIALAALIIAGMSWWSSRISAKASVMSAEAAVQSARSSETSAGAAVRSADAAEKSADAEHEMLQLEIQDRKAAAREQRENVWKVKRITMAHLRFEFSGVEAHDVQFLVDNARADPEDLPPVLRYREAVRVAVLETDHWNKRITVEWAESDREDAERLRRTFLIR